MKTLDGATDDELKAELERRKKIERSPPAPLPNPDFSGLRQMIIEMVANAAVSQCMDEDADHYVYEAAIEAVYGKSFWAWRNKQRW